VDRVKSNHPATFDEALAAYKDAMLRARAHIIEHDIATMPPGEQISVIPTPEYLRQVIPFAAYFEPPKFDKHPSGIYIVTPSVGDDPNAMREHNYASISNTSVHEAYPGHHLQLSAATRHPSLVRLLTDAPEFVEGWGMYSEQMMREQGFDAGPEFMVAMRTDAIWRACRIILDVRMHRGELTVDEATAFLIEHTAFEHANAQAEVFRYTYTPTYQLSYLLGKVLLLQLRADEQKRLGDKFSLKNFHDTLMRNGSLPISFHRRLLAAEAAAGASGAGIAAVGARHPVDRHRQRPLAPGLLAGRGRRRRRADGPAGTDRGAVRGRRRADDPLRGHGRRPRRPSGESWRPWGAWPMRTCGAAPGGRGHGERRTTSASHLPPEPPAWSSPWPWRTARRCSTSASEVAGDWLAVGLDPRPDRIAAYPWRETRRRAWLTWPESWWTMASADSFCHTAARFRTWGSWPNWRGPYAPSCSWREGP
jgi:hypothetical protein